MSYKEKPQLKLYKYENSSFVLQAIIDDYKECSFERNIYQAGQFSITINYNIPNASLFQRGLFVQFGNDPYDFGEIKSITDNIDNTGKGSQQRIITGYDARYILKRRVIKNMNSNGSWAMTAKGEYCLRNLINDQVGANAETKRRLPITNTIPQESSCIGKTYSVSESFTNLYEVCKTIATQSEIGWRIKFQNDTLTLECYLGTNRSQTVRFDTNFESLANGEFSDSSDSYSNTIYIGGKGQNEERDIYEGENLIEGNSPSGFDRFESWDNQSSMNTEDEYRAEANSMLVQYGQTIAVSGNALAKSPYIYKEEYDAGDFITIAFSGKQAVVQILSVQEHWVFGNYEINFSFGKPQNNLADQLQLMLRKIQMASDKSSTIDSVKWYEIPTDNSMPKEDVTCNTLGFTGTIASGGNTFTLYLDNEGTGAKTYNIYVKNLSGNDKLTLTTGKSGAANYQLSAGNYVGQIYVDENGNIFEKSLSATNTISSGNLQPATSNAVYNTLSNFGGFEKIAKDIPNSLTPETLLENGIYKYPAHTHTDSVLYKAGFTDWVYILHEAYDNSGNYASQILTDMKGKMATRGKYNGVWTTVNFTARMNNLEPTGGQGWIDLGSSTTIGSQSDIFIEVTGGRVDQYQGKYLISCNGFIDSSHIKVIEVVNAYSILGFYVSSDSHIWMQVNDYCNFEIKGFGRWTGAGQKITTQPAGLTQLSVNKLVTDEVKTGTITRNTSITSGISEVFASKVGRVAQIHAAIDGCALVANQMITIATVSDEFKPLNPQWQLITLDYVVEGLRGWLMGNGQIQLLSPITTTASIRFDATYISAE